MAASYPRPKRRGSPQRRSTQGSLSRKRIGSVARSPSLVSESIGTVDLSEMLVQGQMVTEQPSPLLSPQPSAIPWVTPMAPPPPKTPSQVVMSLRSKPNYSLILFNDLLFIPTPGGPRTVTVGGSAAGAVATPGPTTAVAFPTAAACAGACTAGATLAATKRVACDGWTRDPVASPAGGHGHL